MSQSHGVRTAALFCLLVLGALLVTDCGKSGPIPQNDCARLLTEAQTSLEAALYTEINSTPDRPADVDFSVPSAKFRQALAGCPTGDPVANFGAAFADLMDLTRDAEVNAAFDEWSAYINSSPTPFHAPAQRSRPLGIPLSLSGGADALRLPFEVVPRSFFAPLHSVATSTDPQIGRVQDILGQRVLPALNNVINRLDYVAGNPLFSFTVTPRMRGDASATPREIDRTDVFAVRAAARLLAAACNAAVSYQLNFAAYDSATLVASLTPGSGWLALKSDGAMHMALARTDMLGAIDDLDLAITSLDAETDDQADDVIKFDPRDFTPANAESLHVYLQRVKASLETEFTLTANWDGNRVTADTPLRIRLGRLFTNPVTDWKAMFPPYSVSTERRAFNRQGQFSFGQEAASVTVPTTRFYSGNVIYSVHGGAPNISFFGDPELESAMTDVMSNQFASASTLPGFIPDSYYSYGSFDGSLNAGLNTIQINWQVSYSLAVTSVHVPVITWTADDFPSWLWPDPSLRGVLPDLLTTTQLESTFGLAAERWQKRNVLDWTGSGSYLKHGDAPMLRAGIARR